MPGKRQRFRGKKIGLRAKYMGIVPLHYASHSLLPLKTLKAMAMVVVKNRSYLARMTAIKKEIAKTLPNAKSIGEKNALQLVMDEVTVKLAAEVGRQQRTNQTYQTGKNRIINPKAPA